MTSLRYQLSDVCSFYFFLSPFLFDFFFVLWLIDPTASGSLRTGQEERKIRRASLLADVHHLLLCVEFILSILGDRTCLELAHTQRSHHQHLRVIVFIASHRIYSETFVTFEFFAEKREDLNPRTRWRSLWTSEANFQTDRQTHGVLFNYYYYTKIPDSRVTLFFLWENPTSNDKGGRNWKKNSIAQKKR